MKLEDVIARVAEATVQEIPAGAPLGLAVVVQRTIEAMGLAIADNGDVYDPARADEQLGAPPLPPPRPLRRGDFMMRQLKRGRR